MICLGHLDAPGARRVRRHFGTRALVLGQPNLEAREVVAAIASAAPDALLSWFWPKQIPASVLQLPARGAYGVHPSLLPRWRGPDPYFWAIYAGDTETGVTLHALEKEYDTGAIIEQKALAIRPNENAWSLARRLDRLSLPLLVSAAERLSKGLPLAGRAQEPALVTEAPAPEETSLSIDWSKSAEDVLRLVRAAAPYPGASAVLGATMVEVLEAERCPRHLPRALAPAEAVLVGQDVTIQSGGGGVTLLRVRTEDGEVLHGAAIAGLFPGGLTRV